MFRSQYPDAPNLFSNVRRPYRRDLGQEFKKSWLTSSIGISLVVAGIVLLVYNEGRAVQTARALDEGRRKVLIPETTDVVFDENNGKLVLVSGPLSIEDAIEDPLYGISTRSVKVKKRVQMYQWYETADHAEVPNAVHEGDHDAHQSTSYSYARDWFDKRIDSEAFQNPMGHHNTEDWPFNSSILINSRAKIGQFLLGNRIKEMFSDFTQFTSDDRPSNRDIKMHAGLYFHAKDVWEPEVGDVRVQFSYAGKDGTLVTVMGKQSGREIRPYQTETGQELLFLHYGMKKPEEVFHVEHAQNAVQTWLYRLMGWFATFIGFYCLTVVLDILVDDSPQIRRVLVLGVTSLPFSFSLSSTLLFVGVGWVVYRPFFGIALLTTAVTPFVIAGYRINQQRELEWRRRL